MKINKIKNKMLICGILSALPLVVAIAAVRSRTPPFSITREQFESLRPGMTRAEVERLLGGPPRNDLRYPAIIWLPQATGKPISARIGPVSPAAEFIVREDRPKNAPQPVSVSALDFFPQEAAKDDHRTLWVTRAGLIAVNFGQDGRLRHKYTSTVDESVPPSVMDWLASRPTMIRHSLGF
jgi:hypothetical protein